MDIFKFPEELLDIIKVFDNKINQKILGILIIEDEDYMSYKDLRDKINISESNLISHLNQLVGGALLENFIRNGKIEQIDSFYRISKFGIEFLSVLLKFINGG